MYPVVEAQDAPTQLVMCLQAHGDLVVVLGGCPPGKPGLVKAPAKPGERKVVDSASCIALLLLGQGEILPTHANEQYSHNDKDC